MKQCWEYPTSDQLASRNDPLRYFAHLFIFFLGVGLEELEGVFLGDIAPFHKDALGPLDEFPGLHGVLEIVYLYLEASELVKPGERELYGRLQLFFCDGFYEVREYPGLYGLCGHFVRRDAGYEDDRYGAF